jgi:hypothetical protein
VPRNNWYAEPYPKPLTQLVYALGRLRRTGT